MAHNCRVQQKQQNVSWKQSTSQKANPFAVSTDLPGENEVEYQDDARAHVHRPRYWPELDQPRLVAIGLHNARQPEQS